MDWQTYAAAGVVVITLVILLVFATRPKKGGSCGKGCGCDHKHDH